MPWREHHDTERRFMLIEPYGRVAGQDYVDSVEAFHLAAAKGGGPDDWRVISDFRRVELLEPSMTPALVRTVGLRHAKRMAEAPRTRSVWITGSGLLFGFVRMHLGFAQRSAEQAAQVTSMPQALARLGLEPDVLPDWANLD